jgi:formylglycine-generating enzyme required for sulfatase activity
MGMRQGHAWARAAPVTLVATSFAVTAVVTTPAPAAPRAPAGMVTVGPGVLKPVFPATPAEADIPVGAFLLDRVPVTESRFLAFVESHPEWRRDRVPRVFVDEGYLSHWDTPASLPGEYDGAEPVTRVSWFAARAFCAAHGARLPREVEWELAAAAGDRGPSGAAEPGWTERILQWYAKPTPKVPPDVGGGRPDFWGVHDLHGLVWEWVEDFNATLLTTDVRGKDGASRGQFCGAGALKATSPEDYAGFMRIAFRSSLQARYTTANLGFRCARSL